MIMETEKSHDLPRVLSAVWVQRPDNPEGSSVKFQSESKCPKPGASMS